MIPTFITVRNASGRLPSKCLLPLGTCNVLEHVIRRCRHFGFRPIVCTTTEKTDNVIEFIANAESVEIFRGDPENVHGRWMACAASFDTRIFHTVDCDDPYFDPLEVNRSITFLLGKKLYSVLPTASSALHGLGMMGTSFNTIGTGSIVMPERQAEFHVRLTLDYPEDYWLLRTLNQLHCGWTTPRAAVELEIKSNPISALNAFRHVNWQATQAMEKKTQSMANG